MAAEAPILTVDSDGPVRIVTLNKPDTLNAMSNDLHNALASVWQQLKASANGSEALVGDRDR